MATSGDTCNPAWALHSSSRRYNNTSFINIETYSFVGHTKTSSNTIFRRFRFWNIFYISKALLIFIISHGIFFVLFERINLQRITVDNVDEKMNHTSVYTRSCIEITNENKNQMQDRKNAINIRNRNCKNEEDSNKVVFIIL